MPRFFTRFLFIIGIAVSLLFPNATFASTCVDPTGFCMDAEKCLDFKEKTPGVTWEHTDDCKASDGLLCCRPPGGLPNQGTTVDQSAPVPKPVGGLVLPACTKTGNCSLDDIVQTGVNFANFLIGLSGALFFMIFLYGGAMYLLSYGDKARVDKGKAAIKGAAIGIILVMGAWTIVRTIYSAVTPTAAPSAGKLSACKSKGKEWNCQKPSDDLVCQTGLCPGGADNVCCSPK